MTKDRDELYGLNLRGTDRPMPFINPYRTTGELNDIELFKLERHPLEIADAIIDTYSKEGPAGIAKVPGVTYREFIVPGVLVQTLTFAAMSSGVGLATDLQSGMKSGKFTARSLVEKYLARIEEIDKRGPAINSIIELNPDALSIADTLDRERKSKGPRGPLHGIPALIKDNIDTADKMMTTAGSLALIGSKPPQDS